MDLSTPASRHIMGDRGLALANECDLVQTKKETHNNVVHT